MSYASPHSKKYASGHPQTEMIENKALKRDLHAESKRKTSPNPKQS